MKRLILSSCLLLFQVAYADNVIYKCTSSTGEITYQNNMGDKSECVKTNFASFPNINFFKSNDLKKSSPVFHSTKENYTPTNNVNVSEEQKIRDTKRILILTQELNQEQEQLNTVSAMLKNLTDTNSKDSVQISQLEELKTSHLNNIKAIKRELGTTKIVDNSGDLKIEKASLEPNLKDKTMMITKPLTPSSNDLPTSLPNTKPNINSVSLTTNLKKQNISIVKKESIKPKTIQEIKHVAKNEVITKDKLKMNEKRKSNSLGNTFVYSSGLSGMSKVKN